MKILCNACEATEATVLCCADEAALCWDCDDKVHAANKLAGKHQRVPLLSASSSPSSFQVPKCDICQEASAYFFCLEDRAILCRNCDFSVHTANPRVSIHQRFLLTGVQVGLESTSSFPSDSKDQSSSANGVPEPSPNQPKSYSGEMNEVISSVVAKEITEWPLDELFRFTDFDKSYGFTVNGSSSKADSGKHASSECCWFDEDMEAERLDPQVPEIPSPPTASRLLHWPRNSQCTSSETESASFVPDISTLQKPYSYQSRPTLTKRKRS